MILFYTIRYINIRKLLLSTNAFLIVWMATFIFLGRNHILDIFPTISICSFFGGFTACIGYFFYGANTSRNYQITSTGLVTNNQTIAWEAIKSYKIDDASTEFKTFNIHTEHGTLRISHRKRFALKDDFEKFIEAFEQQVQIINSQSEHTIVRHPHWLETKLGKVYAIALLIILIACTGTLFVAKDFWKSLSYYLILLGGALPILAKFIKNRDS